MYKPVQKKNSSWTPSTVQKKGKSPSKLGHFSIQPKSNPSSTSSQEIGEYSRDSADRLTANVMRGIQAKKQEEAEGSKVQPKFESPWAPTFEPPPPLPESPASKLKGAFAPVSENPIQRQCADCAKEEKEQVGEERKDLDEIGIQTKLTVGAPGDTYEQEADRVASQVMSMSAPADSSASVQRQLDTNHPHHPHQIWKRAQSIQPVMQRQIDPRVQMRQMIQRAAQIDGNQASGDLESRLNASKGGGSPLSENVRGFMEPRFGADFSGVRVHTGGEAVQMNRELGAQAFTHGSDVYFGAGKEPGNNELTAHELTHVVQQTGGGMQRKSTEASADKAHQIKFETIPFMHDDYGQKIHPLVAPTIEQINSPQVYEAIVQRNPLGQAAAKAAQKALRWLAKRGPNVSNHVFKRHVAKNMARYLTRSKFVRGEFVKKWVQKALKNPDNVVDQGRRIVFEKQLGLKIGGGGETIIRVVVDKATGKIVTAFPTNAFKILSAAAVITASTSSARADAKILSRRKAIAEWEAEREGLTTMLIDFFIGPSRIARDEDILAEERIIDKAIHEAIHKIQEAEQKTLSQEEIEEVKEIILTEMETTPTAG
ncbi:eCIS core domain-containing protein [Coleofasciculus sp. E1-EBD-02]|uniref:eCIS core domain-containing protein n=1 Tax=Coleofasciculus sp. E1-EBD-02 TaxID=3068481 RepID=UPI0032FF20A6